MKQASFSIGDYKVLFSQSFNTVTNEITRLFFNGDDVAIGFSFVLVPLEDDPPEPTMKMVISKKKKADKPTFNVSIEIPVTQADMLINGTIGDAADFEIDGYAFKVSFYLSGRRKYWLLTPTITYKKVSQDGAS